MVRAWVLLLLIGSQILLGQEKSPKISREEALDEALSLVLSDHQSPESPLALSLSAICEGVGNDPEIVEEEAARQLLREHLERSSTRISLYTGEERGMPEPEFGEDPSANWIFLLEIPSLSDHYFWIVIDKKKERGSIVYGFN